jgi:hypothetical protein
MATIAKLVAELSLDNNAFLRGLDGARGGLDSFGAKARNAGRSLTGWVTTPILGAGAALVGWAAAQENAMGKTDAVFGSSAATVLAWSETTAKAYGISRTQALQAAGGFGALFTLMGQTDAASAQYSTTLVGLSADMAAFNDVSTDRASAAIQAGLTGEYESLKSMGVFLNEAIVGEEALAIAMADGRTEVTEADKVMARYNLILEQTTQQQGQAAREADSFNGKMGRLVARFKDLGARLGSRLLGPMGAFLGFLERIIGGLEKLSPKMQTWILAIAAAAAALGPLLIVIGMMLPGLSALLAVIGLLVSPIGLVIAAVGILAYIFRDELGAALDWVIEKVGEVITAWQNMRTMGLNPLEAAFAALQQVFPPLSEAFRFMRMAATDLTDAFNAFRDGNYAEAFDELWDAVQNLGSAFLALGQAVWDALSSINWAGIASSIAGWLGERISAINWSGLIGGLANLASEIDSKIREAVNAVDWGKLGMWAGQLVRAAFVTAGGLIADGFREGASDPGKWARIALAIGVSVLALPTLLAGWIGDVMKGPAADFIAGFIEGLEINWISVAFWISAIPGKITAKLTSLATTLLAKGIELLEGFKTGMSLGWLVVTTWLTGMAARIMAAVTSLAVTLLAKGMELMDGLMNGILLGWFAVLTWLSALPGKIVSTVPSLISTLIPHGTQLMSGLRAGILSGWEAARVWLAGLASRVTSTVGSLISTLLQKGKDLIAGLFTGILNVWDSVAAFLRTVKTLAVTHVGSLSSTLSSRGVELISGLLNGITIRWVIAAAWLSSIPGKAVNAVGSLAGVLTSAGSSLIGGLISGISSRIGELQDLLGSVTSMIPDWKGPPERDRKLLVANGVLIMQGLGEGLDRGWNDITRQLHGYTPSMSGLVDVDGTGAAGGVHHHHYYSVTPDDLRNLIENAKAGGTFARQFGAELAMRGGMS